MKFSKTLFLAAATVLAGTAIPAQAVELLNLNGGTIYTKDIDDRTVNVSGNGTLVVNDGWVVIENTTFSGFVNARLNGPTNSIRWNSLLGDRALTTSNAMQGSAVVAVDGTTAWKDANTQSWEAGTLKISKDNAVRLYGQINSWSDFGGRYDIPIAGSPAEQLPTRMAGVDKIEMGAGSSLEIFDYANYSDAPVNEVIIQYLHNIKSENNNISSTLKTRSGTNAHKYFVNIHIDDTDGGSLGKISGSANIVKTGTGNFTLTGESNEFRSSGDNYSANVFVAGGSLTLAAAEVAGGNASYDTTKVLKNFCEATGIEYKFGQTLYNANSINLAGTAAKHANGYGSYSTSDRFNIGDTTHVYESYVGELIDAPEASALLIKNNQVIKNFQAMFANGKEADATGSIESAINSAVNTNNINPIVTGTGEGSRVGIKEGSILAVNQEKGHGGIYKGSLVGIGADGNASVDALGGTFIKYGKGDLALILEGANIQRLVALEGRLVVNIRTLNLSSSATGIEVSSGARLTIIENETTTLEKPLSSERDSDLEFATYAYIDTLGGSIDVSNNRAPGTIEIKAAQDIKGNLVVREGITIKPTGENALSQAQSIVLLGTGDGSAGATSKTSTLAFGSANQTIKNVIGDKNSQILTGTASRIELNIEDGAYVGSLDLGALNGGKYGTFAGSISGHGNIIKSGAGTLNFAGAGSGIINYGAMIIKEGALAGTKLTLSNASALILNKGTTATFSGDQRLVALYGAAGTSVTLAGGNLIIGESTSRPGELVNTDTNPATNYLSLASDRKIFEGKTNVTESFKPFIDLAEGFKPSPGLVEGDLKAALKDFARSASTTTEQLNLLKDLFGDQSIKKFTDLTEKHLATAYLRLLNDNEILEDVGTQFAGDVTAQIIAKYGSSEQSILGKIKTTGIRVAEGTLAIGGDSLQQATTVVVESNGKFAVNVAGTVSENKVSIEGQGDLEIKSDVNLDLNKQFVNTTTGKIQFTGTKTDGKNVDFTMTLRNATGTLAAQGAITTTKANLILDQASTMVEWGKQLTVGGNLTKRGNAELTLVSSDSSVAGTVAVEAGILNLKEWKTGDNAAFKDLSIATGASLNLEFASDVSFAGTTSGAGTLVKSGAGMLTMSNDEAGTFAGAIDLAAGTLKLSSENYFGSKTIVSVAQSATLDLQKSQTFASLEGKGTIKLADNTTLTVAANNADATIKMNSNTGRYIATIPEMLVGSFVGSISGTNTSKIEINGTGAFNLGGTTIANAVAINISTGQLVLDASSANRSNITTSGTGEMVYNVAEGSTNINNATTMPTTFGKVGAGTLSLTGDQVANKNISIYQGTIELTGNNTLGFGSVKIAAGTTLNVQSFGIASNINLQKIEGSGTLVFENTGTISELILNNTTMLPTSGEKYFNGDVKFVNMNLKVENDVSMTAIGMDENSTLNVVGGANLSITQSANTEFAGTVTVEDSGSINVSSKKDANGNFYKLAFTGTEVKGDINVNNGAVQIKQSEDLGGKTLTATGAADLYFSIDESSVAANKLTSAKVNVAGASSVRLIKTGTGTMKLDGRGNPFENIEFVSSNGRARMASPTPPMPVTLGVDNGHLELSYVDQMQGISLATYGAGTLALEGAQTLDRSITGDGKVKKTGVGTLTVTSNQAFTGTFELAAGKTVFENNVSLETSQLIVNGNATATGSLTLTNTASESVLNLKENGKLILKDGTSVSYAGTLKVADIAGTIELAGTPSNSEIVVLKALGEHADLSLSDQRALLDHIELDMVGANKFMLAQNAGTISVFTMGDSLTSGVSVHEGLGGFVSILDNLMPQGDKVLEADMNPLLAKLLRAGSAGIATEIEKLSPLSYSAMVAMSWQAHNNDIGQFRNRATARRFELVNEFASRDLQFWATAQGTFAQNGNGNDAAVYDFNTFGAVIGADTKIDDYTLLGFALGYDYGSADINNGGGKIKSNDYRLTAYGSSLVGDGSWFVDYGATIAMSNYDVKRNTILGNATAKPDGFSLGAYGVLGRGFLIAVDRDQRLVLTPYAGLSAYYTTIGDEKEAGGADLEIDKIKALSVRGMLGASLDWVFPFDDYEGRFGIDAAFAHEFGDSEVDVDAKYDGQKTTVKAAGIAENTFSIGPTLSLTVGYRTNIHLGYRAEFGTNENVSHNVNLGFRRTF